MKIKVLKNFGLDGQNLEADTVIDVDKAHFGDNERSFRDEGYFEDFIEPPTEAEPVATPASAKPKATPQPEATGAEGQP